MGGTNGCLNWDYNLYNRAWGHNYVPPFNSTIQRSYSVGASSMSGPPPGVPSLIPCLAAPPPGIFPQPIVTPGYISPTPQTADNIPWHGQYSQSGNQHVLTLNGQQIPQGYDGSTPFTRMGTDPMSAIQLGPDVTPHVATNFHSLIPRMDVEEHFKRTNSVTIGGNTVDAAETLSSHRSSIAQQTIFGPQDDQIFRRSIYPPPFPTNNQNQSQLGTNLYPGQSPVRQTNYSAQTASYIPGLPIMSSRAPSGFQQSPIRGTVRY